MKRKKPLEYNNKKIAIVAPASGSSDGDNEHKLHLAKDYLQEFNLEIIGDEQQLFGGESLPYFANTLSNRVSHFLEAMNDKDVEIIWTYRGGYGSFEVCRQLLRSGMLRSHIGRPSKIFIGFSDATSIHVLLNQKLGWPTIHGPVLHSIIGKQAQMQQAMAAIMQGEDVNLALTPINKNCKEPIMGDVAGGNLAVLDSLVGTELELDMRNKIIFFEDVNEPSYKIHRMLGHLLSSTNSNMAEATALIFGDFIGRDEFLDKTIERFLADYLPATPAFYAKDIGHGEQNMPIIMGIGGKIGNSSQSWALTAHNPFKVAFNES